MIRILLAAVFVVAGLLLYVGLMVSVFPHTTRAEDVLIEIGLGLLFCLLLAAAVHLFGDHAGRPTHGFDQDQYIKDLEEKGLLVSTDYQATRAFQLEEYEDEGSHYFVELADGSVMYFVGQYLYEYEPIDDDPELNQPRRFPCTEFSLRSHRDEKCKIDIQCRGTAIEPEFVEPHPKCFWKRELEDGQIVTDQTYNEIKEQLTREGRRR